MQKNNIISEFSIIILLGLVQFIDIFDFMVVMPLGPDYSKALSVDQSKLGWMAASYTIAASFSGICAAYFLDRFERKRALIFSLCGLVSASLISSLSHNFETLLCARFIAGLFGGPTTAVTFAIIGDLVASNRRGLVIGKVMTAFSCAATIGVPIGLEISRRFGWQNAFLMVFICGLLVILIVAKFLPKIDLHLEHNKTNNIQYRKLFADKTYLQAYFCAALGYISIFMIIPYISAFLQLNMSFDRSCLGALYFCGGLCSFVAAQMFGKYVDAHSSSLVTGLTAMIIFSAMLFLNKYFMGLWVIFISYSFLMIGISTRNIAHHTLMTKVSASHDRAAFMSVLSSIVHISSALGAFISSSILVQSDIGMPLVGVQTVMSIAVITMLSTPIFMKIIEKKLVQK